ncbi:hypothetical protein EIP91_002208 [Steccherinum ochraceum]|uniref:Uncharacterized protein n=1 Tax=Steccherinum ochraceum TaxID=92696 RepID=A0A4R0RL03_9APHY|nr:hypothetical protein EIP91_002208 [Steccherinum ochraceum]
MGNKADLRRQFQLEIREAAKRSQWVLGASKIDVLRSGEAPLPPVEDDPRATLRVLRSEADRTPALSRLYRRDNLRLKPQTVITRLTRPCKPEVKEAYRFRAYDTWIPKRPGGEPILAKLKRARNREMRKIERQAAWASEAANAATIRVPTTLDELRARADNDAELEKAKDTVKAMFERPQDYPTRTTTAKYVGEDGKPLLIYLSKHQETSKEGELLWKKRAPGQVRRKPVMKNDGIAVSASVMPRQVASDKVLQQRYLDRFMLDVQKLANFKQRPIGVGKEVDRHPATTEEEVYHVYRMKGEKKVWEEFSLWIDMKLVFSGIKTRLRPSVDLLGKDDEEFFTIAEYLAGDDPIQFYLEEVLKKQMPDEFAALQETGRKARWIRERLLERRVAAGEKWAKMEGCSPYISEGIFMNRVTLYKLQTSLHRDKKDYLCVIFCAGEFIGGEGLFPDLGVKLKYRPGDVIIFYSDALYHAVAPWVATIGQSVNGIAPGRNSRVFNTHVDTMETLSRPYPDEWICKGRPTSKEDMKLGAHAAVILQQMRERKSNPERFIEIEGACGDDVLWADDELMQTLENMTLE